MVHGLSQLKMIQWFESKYPDYPIIPNKKFFGFLIEDWADENGGGQLNAKFLIYEEGLICFLAF